MKTMNDTEYKDWLLDTSIEFGCWYYNTSNINDYYSWQPIGWESDTTH